MRRFATETQNQRSKMTEAGSLSKKEMLATMSQRLTANKGKT
jgi:hypothetical protein